MNEIPDNAVPVRANESLRSSMPVGEAKQVGRTYDGRTSRRLRVRQADVAGPLCQSPMGASSRSSLLPLERDDQVLAGLRSSGDHTEDLKPR